MPTGPKGQKRPADVIGNAIKVACIATGEEPDDAPVDDGKDPAAKALGAKGGAARAKVITPERRAGIADRLWSMEDVVALIDAREAAPGKCGPSKKRAAT